jgi:carboxypeptidase C (cathepsin A)
MEMGYFQVYDHGVYVNPFAWNRVSNMLYLETPAGAGFATGYSACIQDGTAVDCTWDDVTQAEAYAFTLQAFFKAFPEYAMHDLYLTGESYFGAYGPNIAHYILNHSPFNTSFRLKGMALGNSCWDANCCGPNYEKYDVDFLFGKGLYSKELYTAIYAACKFPDVSGTECAGLLKRMRSEIGPHDPENVYNNCPATEQFLEETGRDMGWLIEYIRAGRAGHRELRGEITAADGGYRWACGGFGAALKWAVRPDVRKALHLDQIAPGRSSFNYNISGPYALTLYPELMRRIRILVYNGDADPSVPYQGIEDWIGNFQARGLLKASSPWSPWRVNGSSAGPVAGSIVKYAVPGSAMDFSFALVRLAGHTVPTFQPEAALTMISSFLGAGQGSPIIYA